MTTRQPRTRTTVAVVVAFLAALSGDCALAGRGKRPRGADVVVQQTGGVKVKGELIGVRPDALVLSTKKGAATVLLSDIESVWTLKEMSVDGKVALALGGLVGGAALGVGAAKAVDVSAHDLGEAIGLGALFVLGGIVAGEGLAAYIGTRKHKGTVFDLKNKSPEEVGQILTELRRLARVPDYR